MSGYAILVKTNDFQQNKKETAMKFLNWLINHIILNLNGN